MAIANEKQEGGLQRWLRETRAEMRKVTWPTREEAFRLTYIVVILSVVMGLLLGGVDLLLSSLYALAVR